MQNKSEGLCPDDVNVFFRLTRSSCHNDKEGMMVGVGEEGRLGGGGRSVKQPVSFSPSLAVVVLIPRKDCPLRVKSPWTCGGQSGCYLDHFVPAREHPPSPSPLLSTPSRRLRSSFRLAAQPFRPQTEKNLGWILEESGALVEERRSWMGKARSCFGVDGIPCFVYPLMGETIVRYCGLFTVCGAVGSLKPHAIAIFTWS